MSEHNHKKPFARPKYTSCMKWGNNILLRGLDEHGNRCVEKIKYCPELFVRSEIDHGYYSINGDYLMPMMFDNIKDAASYIKSMPPGEVFGMDRFEYCVSSTYNLHLKPRIKIIDIETECEEGFPDITTANEEIICVSFMFSDEITTIASKKYATEPLTPKNSKHTIIECDGEYNLLLETLRVWKKIDADIVTGWNVNLFDLPYLYNRMVRVFGEKKAKELSPWKAVTSRSAMINGQQQTSYVFYGINILDYYDLYRKFTYQQQPSYKLDYIASIELGEKKLSYKEHDSIHEFYKSDWSKFIDYNVKDVTLISALDKKLKFIDLALAACADAHANPHDIFSQVRMWDLLIYNHLLKKFIQIPSRREESSVKSEKYEGAYVKEPVPGMYEWVIALDVASMYPNAIRYLNISPETILSYEEFDSLPTPIKLLKSSSADRNIQTIIQHCEDDAIKLGDIAARENVSISPTGDVYKKSVDGFLPEMMKQLFVKRTVSKTMSKKYEEYAKAIRKELERRGIDV